MTSPNLPYTIGLTLSGGGVKGFAHAGILQALHERNIKPEIISGTSAGAVVAAMYASGCTPIDILTAFSDKSFYNYAALNMRAGLFSLKKFGRFLAKHIHCENIEDLPIALRIVSSDLDHGKSVVFTQGPLIERVLASATVPVIFEPTLIDGTRYVDGGVFRNFPVREIRNECKMVIGANVSPLVPDRYEPSMVGIAERAYNFMFRANTLEDRKLCDVLIEIPEALAFGTFDLSKTDQIFELGYNSACSAIDEYLAKNQPTTRQ